MAKVGACAPPSRREVVVPLQMVEESCGRLRHVTPRPSLMGRPPHWKKNLLEGKKHPEQW